MGWDALVRAGTVALTLWLSCVVFLFPLKHRSHYQLRCGLFLALALTGTALSAALRLESSGPVLAAACLYAFLFQWACGKADLAAALYCGVWAVVSQQLVLEVWRLSWFWWEPALRLGRLWWAVGAVLFGAAYGILGRTLARWMPENGQYRAGPRQVSSALGLLVLFEVLFSIVMDGSGHIGPYSVTILLAQLYCVTMLYLQNALFKKSAMKQELDTLNRLWYQQKEHYSLAKENIAIINRKCHDLKHQMAAMRTLSSPQEQDKYLREIADSVQIYDSMVQTGNEVLDTVLTEKSLYCEANKITVNCVADGSLLGFMDPVDVYGILGNALDNAIESVKGLQDPEKRFIDVLICAERQFLLLRVINPLEGKLTFEDGLPLSTKAHDGYHGFGLKSMRHTARKYGGFLTVAEESQCFVLRILLPLSGQA